MRLKPEDSVVQRRLFEEEVIKVSGLKGIDPHVKAPPLYKRIAMFVGTEEGRHLKEIYEAFKGHAPETVRARIYDNLDRIFKKLDRGVYVATVEGAMCVILKGDAWEDLRLIESGSIQLVVTDHAWTWTNEWVSMGTTRKKTNKLTYTTRDPDDELIGEVKRILKPGGYWLVYTPAESKLTRTRIEAFIGQLEQQGFEFNKRLIHDLGYIGMGYNGRNSYYPVLFMSKGKRRIPADRKVPDLIRGWRISPLKRVHEDEKEVGVLRQLVRLSCYPGEWMLDFMAGSGKAGLAALLEGVNAILIEKDQDIFKNKLLPHFPNAVKIDDDGMTRIYAAGSEYGVPN